MGTRPFAYNATQTAITGTVNAGTICIGVSALDYSSKPGGLTWWNGPDEDNSYVICKAVPAQNFPTPVGNVGGVEFWKCTNTDEAFRSLVQIISGTSQATASAAGTWLISNGYWSSWSFDSDAQAFINAAGITGATEQYAVSNLVLGLKSDGIWNNMIAVYPFVGGSATSHKYNLKDPRDLDAAFRLTFHGGITHDSYGILPDGTNGYVNTKFAPSSNWIGGNSSMSVYSRTANIDNGKLWGTASANGNTTFSAIIKTTVSSNVIFYNSSISVNILTLTSSAVNLMVSRINSSNVIIGRNEVTSSYSRAESSFSSSPIFLSANNQNGTVESGSYSNRQIAFSHIGYGLTTTQCTQLYNRIQTFQTTLGRQV